MSRFFRVMLALGVFLGAGALSAETPWVGEPGIRRTTEEIMFQESISPPRADYPRYRHAKRDRTALPQDPDSPAVSAWPPRPETPLAPLAPLAPTAAQTVGLQFTATTNTSFPPDTMGAVGPTQFIAFVNGRIRSYNKATGTADAVLNVNPDTFFSSVITPATGSVVFSFTSDPRIRYDRLTGRWYLIIIDVPCTDAQCNSIAPNRVLFAVSDTSTITGSTVWTFSYFQHDLVSPAGNTGEFADYPTLGLDANALYIGINMFGASFSGTTGFVVRKSSLTSGPIVATAFRGLATGGGAGPYTPQGVDNFDPAATEGWFIGVDNANYGRLVLRRVSNPGGSPTISANINITVPSTSNPIDVNHLGNTGGNNGRLDSLDDRLFAAHYRNGRLWTAHNIAVTAAGAASNADAQRRTAVRWYELTGIPTGNTPSVVQSGTIYDSTANLVDARQFSIPSVMVSGQGHAALGFTSAGTNFRINAATVGRWSGDTLGTFQVPAALGDMSYTASGTAYNPAGDPGSAYGRRWGDYSYTSLDPLDDMTMWTIQEFCSGNNAHGERVAKLIAPPPATPTGSYSVNATGASQVVNIVGTSTAGSGFFDPGANLAAPALAFSHITAAVYDTGTTTPSPNVTVNSVTYTDPTHVTINITTTGAAGGAHDLRITNPDGQYVTTTLTVNAPCVPPAAPSAGNNGPLCVGGTLNLSTPTVGGATYAWTGPNGFASALQNPSITGVTLAAGGTYNVTVSVGGCTSAAGSTSVTVNPDAVAPTVTAPSPVTVDQSLCCGTFGGATGATKAALNTFLNAATAVDACDPTPTMLSSHLNGGAVTGSTCFEAGTSTVTFRFRDDALNIGTADSTVTVRMFGDLNLDALVDGSDYVILRDYLNFVASPGVPPFNAPLSLADLNHDATVDPGDFVVIRDYMNFVTPCLAP